MDDMRIVFMGTPDFAEAVLDRLIQTGRNVVGVFSQPDKPVGRHQVLEPTPVKKLAKEHGIPVCQPSKMKDGTALAMMKDFSPDLVVVAAYGRILPPDLLAVPRLGCVNIHGSLLPKYRGAAPIQWSVINGDEITGVTAMYMAEGMDTGDMILKLTTPIGPDETSGELFDRLALLGADAIEKTLELFDSGSVPREKQDDSQATMAPMLKKDIAIIDFNMTAKRIHDFVRGMEPWPEAYTSLDGKTLKVHSAVEAAGFSGMLGELLDEKRLIVGCGGGAVELTEVQPEGKKRMTGADFIRGKRLERGARFGG